MKLYIENVLYYRPFPISKCASLILVHFAFALLFYGLRYRRLRQCYECEAQTM